MEGMVGFKTDASFFQRSRVQVFAWRSANEVSIVFLGPYMQIQGQRLRPREDLLLPHSLHFIVDKSSDQPTLCNKLPNMVFKRRSS
jgi:hypothetical protein